MVKNRLKWWRHELRIDSQVEFARLLGVSHYTLNRWELQQIQPGRDALVKIYLKLKPLIPDLHMEDLLEIEGPE